MANRESRVAREQPIRRRHESSAETRKAVQEAHRRRAQKEGQARRETQAVRQRERQGEEARPKPESKEEVKPQKPQEKIPFKEAAAAAKVIAEIQSAEGRQVTVKAEEYAALKEVLAKAGFTFKQVQKMPEAQIIVEAQKVFVNKETVVEEPEFREQTSAGKLEQDLAVRRVESVRNPTEEILTVGLVKERVMELEQSGKNDDEVAIGKGETARENMRDVTTKVVIESDRPLAVLNREEVLNSLAESDALVDIPKDWDEMKEGPREDCLNEQKVINEVRVKIEKREINGRQYLTWETEEGDRTVYGFDKDWKAKDVQEVFNSLGIKVKLPRDWDLSGKKQHPAWQKKDWLQRKGIKAYGAIENQDQGSVIEDADILGVTRQQAERIFEVEVPKNWGAMSMDQRRLWALENKFLPVIGGAGTDVPEWSDDIPNPDFDPTLPISPDNPARIRNKEANSRVLLGEAISRRIHLLHRGLIRTDPNSDWMELGTRINELVTAIGGDSRYVWVRMQIDHFEQLYRKFETTASLAEINVAIDPTLQARLRTRLTTLNTNFQNMVDTDPRLATKTAKDELFSDLQKIETDRLGSALLGYISQEQYQVELMNKAQERPGELPRGMQGIREWYVFEKILPRVEELMLEHRDLSLVTDPEEYEKAVRRALRRAESSTLAGSDLNNYYQKILAVVSNAPARTEGQIELKNRLSSEIQASLLMNQLYLEAEKSEGNPDKYLPIFEQIRNLHAEHGFNTLQYFMRRFRMKYSNDEAIEDDENEPLYKVEATKTGYDFNILSDILNVYYNTFANERIIQNELENAQREKRGFDHSKFPPGYVPPVDLVFSSVPKQVEINKGLLREWLQRNTFIYATSKEKDPVTGLNYVDLQNQRMLERIRDHLINVREMSPEHVNRISVIIKAANLAAFRFVQVFGGSEYEGVDVFNDKAEAVPGAIYGERMPHMARMVDNPLKFFRFEERGRPETNKIFEEEQTLGYVLPTVRVLVRFTDIMRFGDNTLSRLTPDEVTALNDNRNPDNKWGGLGLGPDANIKKAVEELTKRLQKAFDTTEADAEGVAIAYLIDKGYIRFGRSAANATEVDKLVDWEEGVKDLTRFNFMDTYGDRAAARAMEDRGALQEFLRNPTFATFMEVYGKLFYSGRNKRLFPNMKKGVKAFHRIEQSAKRDFHEPRRGTVAETLENIEIAVRAGRIDPKDDEVLKRDLLGIHLWPGGPQVIPGVWGVRHARAYAEFLYGVGEEWFQLLPFAWLQAILQFFEGLSKQAAQQTAGR